MFVKDIASINPKSDVKIQKLDLIKYIDTASVYDGSLIDVQCISSNYPSRAQRYLKHNDIIISSVRPNLKHNYFVKEKQNGYIGSSGFIQIRVNNHYIPKYIYYFLTTDSKISLYSSIADSSQTTFPAFSKDVIENIELPAISIETQQHIVDIVRKDVIIIEII